MEDPQKSAEAKPDRADDHLSTTRAATVAQLQRLLEYACEHDEHPYIGLRPALASIRAYAKVLKNTQAIDKAMNVRRKALDKLATDDVTRVFILSDLAEDFLAKFEVSKLKTDIESGLHLFQRAASSNLLPDEHCFHAIHNIGTALTARYNAFSALSDLDLAIEKFKQALALAPEDGTGRILQLRALGVAYTERYARTRTQEDYEGAKQTLQTIIDMGPWSEEHQGPVLFTLSMLHFCDFLNSVTARRQEAPIDTRLMENDSAVHGRSHVERRKDYQLLKIDEMIRLIQASLQKPSAKDWKLERLSLLSVAYLYRYKLSGTEIDRKTSYGIAQNALAMTIEGNLDRLQLYADLASRHSHAYRITGHVDHLQASIENIERIIEESNPIQAKWFLDLGDLYIMKYERLGCPTDHETGHSLLQQGLSRATSSSVRRQLLVALGGLVYLQRFATGGASADIEAAIDMFEEALQISSETDDTGVKLLVGLGSAYLYRYTRTKSPQDLHTGMDKLEIAHKLASGANLHIADVFSHLAHAHSLLYEEGKDLGPINRAIELVEEALVVGSLDVMQKWEHLDRLSSYYLTRYEHTQDQSDLQTALSRIKEVVEQIPDDHPGRAWLFQKYTALRGMFGGEEIGDTGTDSLSLLEEVLNHGPSPPLQRILAARRLIAKYIVDDAWTLAYRALERTMALVPLLTPNFLRNHDKKSVIDPIAGLATDAAVVALRAGRSPYEAINLIELGRGIIQSSLTSMRTDISKLEEAHPKLAQTFVRYRDLLDTPWLPQEPPSHADSIPLAPGQHPDVRYAAHRELQRTIQEIRNLGGFERFGLGPTESEIKAAAASGPIVMINVSESGKAFIMEVDKIEMLWLPLLSEEAIHEYEVKMRSGQIHATLEWLWRVIVKPVLRVLGYDDKPVDTWPRICWIPTGELIKFPLHAAGLHLQGQSQSLLDRAVSTYSSSLRAVVDARRNGQKSEPSQSTSTVALVGVETTLAAVRSEMDGVSRICRSMGMQVLRPEPFQRDVMAALNSCDMFHFAGHGRTDRDDPLRSGLMLIDGCLTLDTLFQTNLSSRKPFLAFLSACGTGQVTHHSLVNEGLHLIAACQVAGFRMVIGTLWKVRDSVCLDLALRLYEWVSANGLSAESVAEGFHNICRSLRAEWVTKEQRSIKHRNSSGRPFSSDVEDDDEHDMEEGEKQDLATLDWTPFVLYGS